MALLLQGEVVDEWLIDLLPEDYLGVDYVDDVVSHERLALWASVRPACDMGGTFSRW